MKEPTAQITVTTDMGPVLLEANEKAIVRVSLGQKAKNDRNTPLLKKAKKEVQEYFSGKRKTFTVPVHLEGTPFQKDVWNAMKKIPFGKTAGYGELAKRIGRPNAARAVGGACNANQIALMVP